MSAKKSKTKATARKKIIGQKEGHSQKTIGTKKADHFSKEEKRAD